MKPYSGTVCANCGSRQGPFTRRTNIPGSFEHIDLPPGCGVPQRKLRGLKPEERRAVIEKVVLACNERRKKLDNVTE